MALILFSPLNLPSLTVILQEGVLNAWHSVRKVNIIFLRKARALKALAVYAAKTFSLQEPLSMRMIIRYEKMQLEKYQCYRNIFPML